jgi:hypothetical protein
VVAVLDRNEVGSLAEVKVIGSEGRNRLEEIDTIDY